MSADDRYVPIVKVVILQEALELETLGFPQDTKYAWSRGVDADNPPVVVEWDADAEQLGCKLCAAPTQSEISAWYMNNIGRRSSKRLFERVCYVLDASQWHEVRP